MSLTPNAASTMFRMAASGDNPSFSPTLQVVHLKKIDNKSGADERWRVGVVVVLDNNLMVSLLLICFVWSTLGVEGVWGKSVWTTVLLLATYI